MGSEAEKRVEEALRSGTEKLDLSRLELESLPDSLANLTHLTQLDLSDNKLTAVPESLGNLTNLTQLDLEDKEVAVLPVSLARFAESAGLPVAR